MAAMSPNIFASLCGSVNPMAIKNAPERTPTNRIHSFLIHTDLVYLYRTSAIIPPSGLERTLVEFVAAEKTVTL